ncbi:MAG: metalloregulator ArsR/SmtB family transcription factor [Acidobacteriota bacterium]|nr:metalloregulator ArsR/SmtB family transcription factor [Acidobacteriota bacterium]
MCIMTQASKRFPAAKSSLTPADIPDTEGCCPEDFARLFPTGLFRALGDPNRIALLARLAVAPGSQTVSELAGCCPTDLSVVSRHLKTLRDSGIVASEKRGRQVFYSLRYPELAAALRAMADAMDACCSPLGQRPNQRRQGEAK